MLDDWAYFMMLQGQACVVEINYQTNNGGDPAGDQTNCTNYSNALANLPITQQITNPNEVIDVATGIPWLLDTTNGDSCDGNNCMYANTNSTCSSGHPNCGNCGPWAFVSGSLPGSGDNDVGDWMDYCTLPAHGWVPEQPQNQSYLSLVGRHGSPWQVLPYYQDVQKFLNDSLCPGSSGGSQSTLVICLNTRGFEVPGSPPFQIWADSTPFFAGNQPANGWCSNNTDFPSDYPGCVASFNSYGDVSSYWSTTASNSGGSPITGINPACFTSGSDVSANYTVHWECGYVDASANFNEAGDPQAAWFLYEWVGPGAADEAPGLPVTLSDYVLSPSYVPSVSPAVVGAGRRAPIGLGPTATPKPIETATATATPKPAETATPTATARPTTTATASETPKPTETAKPEATATPRP